MVTDGGQRVVREQWKHPYKEGSSLFRFHISVANIVQSSVRCQKTIYLHLIGRRACLNTLQVASIKRMDLDLGRWCLSGPVKRLVYARIDLSLLQCQYISREAWEAQH